MSPLAIILKLTVAPLRNLKLVKASRDHPTNQTSGENLPGSGWLFDGSEGDGKDGAGESPSETKFGRRDEFSGKGE